MVGNGDILTWYEHKQRLDISGASAAMVGRGALIKPWIFKEVLEGKEWEPTPEVRRGSEYHTTALHFCLNPPQQLRVPVHKARIRRGMGSRLTA